MESVGTFLRKRREARAMSVEEVSRATRIPVASLERLEHDRFDDLPGEVFVRGFLRAYARAVALPVEDVLAMYTASRRVAYVTPIPVMSPIQKASKRRFGVAIAFVVLLVLFTLALSIVLKPRGRELPQELSSAPGPTATAIATFGALHGREALGHRTPPDGGAPRPRRSVRRGRRHCDLLHARSRAGGGHRPRGAALAGGAARAGVDAHAGCRRGGEAGRGARHPPSVDARLAANTPDDPSRCDGSGGGRPSLGSHPGATAGSGARGLAGDDGPSRLAGRSRGASCRAAPRRGRAAAARSGRVGALARDLRRVRTTVPRGTRLVAGSVAGDRVPVVRRSRESALGGASRAAPRRDRGGRRRIRPRGRGARAAMGDHRPRGARRRVIN